MHPLHVISSKGFGKPSKGVPHDDRLRASQCPREQLRSLIEGPAAGFLGVIVLMLLPFVGQLGPVYHQAVRFHLAAARTMSHPLRDNLRLIDGMLLAGPSIYIAVLAVLVIAWQRM